MEKFNIFKNYTIEIGKDPENGEHDVYIVVNKHTGVKEIHSSTLPDLLTYVAQMDEHLSEYLNEQPHDSEDNIIKLN